MGLTVEPGPPGTPATRRRAEELRALDRGQLDRVRATAEKWRDGLAVLLGLIAVVGVVKGREDVQELDDPARFVVGALILLALACAAAGTVLAARAAFGLPRRHWLTGEADELDELRETQAADAARDLRLAVVLTLGTLALLAAAVGLTLYAPGAEPDEPVLRVRSPESGEVCGTVERSEAGQLTLKTVDGEVTVDLADALVTVTGAC